MIKVIVIDMKDGETDFVCETRMSLRNDYHKRKLFEENIDIMIKQFINKIIREQQED